MGLELYPDVVIGEYLNVGIWIYREWSLNLENEIKGKRLGTSNKSGIRINDRFGRLGNRNLNNDVGLIFGGK